VKTRFARIVRQPLSNGLGMGIIECDDMSAEWFLNYDEIFYVLEGNFRCVIDGKVYEALVGDTIFLPKNTQLLYETTGKAKLMYIVYPESNGGWRNLIGHD
jgi:ethanolamine utilization protein EutQ